MTYYGDEAFPALSDEQWARLQAYQATVLAMRLRSLEEADQHVGAPGLRQPARRRGGWLWRRRRR
jgi:hypothetical protein